MKLNLWTRRDKVFWIIMHKVFNYQEGCIIPWYGKLLRWILFPLRTLRIKWNMSGYIKEDWETDSIIIGKYKTSKSKLEKLSFLWERIKE